MRGWQGIVEELVGRRYACRCYPRNVVPLQCAADGANYRWSRLVAVINIAVVAKPYIMLLCVDSVSFEGISGLWRVIGIEPCLPTLKVIVVLGLVAARSVVGDEERWLIE
jgi:hypothetical protein